MSTTKLAELVEMSCRASDRMTVVPDQHGWGPDDMRNREEAYSKPWSVQRRGDSFEIAWRDEPHSMQTPLLPRSNARHVVVGALVAALWRLCVELPDDAIVPRPAGDIALGAMRSEGDDRDALAVLADSLMQNEDTLGEWLGLWLDSVKCSSCKGSKVAPIVIDHRRWSPDDLSIKLEGHAGIDVAQSFEFVRKEWRADEVVTDFMNDLREWRTTIHATTVSDVDHRQMPITSFDCSHCHGTGVESGAREQAIAERLDALTWIRDRMPEVGDEIELRYKVYGEADGLLDVVDLEPVTGRVIEVGQNDFIDARIVIQTPHGRTIRYADMIDAWRYRVHSTGAQATADHRADPRPAAPRDARLLP